MEVFVGPAEPPEAEPVDDGAPLLDEASDAALESACVDPLDELDTLPQANTAHATAHNSSEHLILLLHP
jgi:hypothetical protein